MIKKCGKCFWFTKKLTCKIKAPLLTQVLLPLSSPCLSMKSLVFKPLPTRPQICHPDRADIHDWVVTLNNSEYKRMGTLSILAGLDLHDGHVTAEVHPRTRSREFILLLKALDAHYPPGCVIRLVLDNHSFHISKETMSWLATRPSRFLYVHTPKHGSWLNLVETLFGKMARTFLKHIRVASRQELKDRILLGIAEINEAPVVHRWKKFDALNT